MFDYYAMLHRLNEEALRTCEREYLKEPDEYEPKRCACCEGVPDDERLYKYDGEWLCIECLTQALPLRNAYDMREWE